MFQHFLSEPIHCDLEGVRNNAGSPALDQPSSCAACTGLTLPIRLRADGTKQLVPEPTIRT